MINVPPKWLIRAHYPPDQFHIAGGFFLHMDVLMLRGQGRQRAVFAPQPLWLRIFLYLYGPMLCLCCEARDGNEQYLHRSRYGSGYSCIYMGRCCAYAARPGADILLHAISAYTPSLAKMATSSICTAAAMVQDILVFIWADP